MSREMYNYKRKAVRIAKDFRYTTEIIEAIHKAKTENEISNIMRNARLLQRLRMQIRQRRVLVLTLMTIGEVLMVLTDQTRTRLGINHLATRE